MRALKSGGILWISYPKRSAKLPTDLTRDEGWDVITQAGFRGVRQVSIDEVWSAVRFRPLEAGEASVRAQYAGLKATLRPIYDRIIEVARELGDDVEVAPRKTYVALIRKKQFAIIQASTTQRVDLGFKLKGKPPSGRLEGAGNFGSGSITHRVALSDPEAVDAELIAWLREAYEKV